MGDIARLVTRISMGKAKPDELNNIDLEISARVSVDGNLNSAWSGRSVTHTTKKENPWWEVDLGQSYEIEEVLLWNRTEAGQGRLRGARVQLLDEQRDLIWEQTLPEVGVEIDNDKR